MSVIHAASDFAKGEPVSLRLFLNNGNGPVKFVPNYGTVAKVDKKTNKVYVLRKSDGTYIPHLATELTKKRGPKVSATIEVSPTKAIEMVEMPAKDFLKMANKIAEAEDLLTEIREFLEQYAE
jgi:hypothetical protein